MLFAYWFFADFGENSASAFRVKETDVETFGTFAGALVNQTDAFFAKFRECVGGIVNAESDVMDAFATLFNESGDGTLFGSGFQKLDFGLPNHEKGGLYLLVGHLFNGVALQSKHVFVIGNCIFQALNGDANVFNM